MLLQYNAWSDVQQFIWAFVILFTGVISLAGFKTPFPHLDIYNYLFKYLKK
jgi:hypothetical protein